MVSSYRRVEKPEDSASSRGPRRHEPHADNVRPRPPQDRPGIDPRFLEYHRTRDRALRDQLVLDHQWLATHCARRYHGRGESTEDLMQVALLGLVKAVDRYDPTRGAVFSTFAVPTIVGELRRHFRDKTWAVHVPRRAKEHHQLVSDVTEQLTQAFGRSPTTQEIAERAGITVEEVLEALEVGGCYRGVPLVSADDDAPTNDDGPNVGQHDRGYGAAEARLAITSVIHELPARDRYILKLRFVDRLTQTQIGERVGVSQVQVSRLIQASLAKLREQLGAPTP